MKQNYSGVSWYKSYYMKNSDMLDLVEKLPFYYDEPFGDSSTMIVSKLARQSVTVATVEMRLFVGIVNTSF